jgi:hypothetical protein
MYILIVVLGLGMSHAQTTVFQEFSSKETCQAAGAKTWELTGREAKWMCVLK